MIFKKDITKKKTYLIKLSIFCIIIFLVFTAVTFLIIRSAEYSRLFLIKLLSVLFLFYVYLIIRAARNYNNLSIETFEDKMIVKLQNRTIEVQFSEIQEIISYPSVLDKNQLIIICGKWKAIGLNSYIENFDELQKILFAIKPLSPKKHNVRRIFDYSFLISIFSAILAGNIKNFPLSFIFATIGLLSSTLNIIRYSKSKIRNSVKVSGIIAHSVLAASLVFLIVVNGIIANKHTYRKNSEGKTVLMKKEEVSKYDRHGNLKYHKSEYAKEFYKYDTKNNLTYRKYKSGYYEILYTYKNDNLLEQKYTDGCTYTYEYNENGNEICYSDNQGYSEWSTYDSNNNLIETVDSDGFHQFFKYDEHNNLIYQNNDDNEYFIYTYDERNRRIKTEGEDYIMTSVYNDKDQLILQTSVMEDSRISTKKIEYDDRGNEIHLEYISFDNTGKEVYHQDTKKQYDEHNSIIKFQINDESEIEYYYDYDKYGHVLRCYSFSN